MKVLFLSILLSLSLALNACTHIHHETPEGLTYDYWSTKDIKGLSLETDGITVSLDGSENQAGEVLKDALEIYLNKGLGGLTE